MTQAETQAENILETLRNYHKTTEMEVDNDDIVSAMLTASTVAADEFDYSAILDLADMLREFADKC